jgi:hypothetical protein
MRLSPSKGSLCILKLIPANKPGSPMNVSISALRVISRMYKMHAFDISTVEFAQRPRKSITCCRSRSSCLSAQQKCRHRTAFAFQKNLDRFATIGLPAQEHSIPCEPAPSCHRLCTVPRHGGRFRLAWHLSAYSWPGIPFAVLPRSAGRPHPASCH